MSACDLSGKSILVVEDDHFLASDTIAALRAAGATIMGPCSNVEAAYRHMDVALPTAAVLDLNLGGGGPRFEVARRLQNRGVPFIFVTGYQPSVLPDDMENVQVLQKPVSMQDVIVAVSRL
jgi:DNA-binding response OmpR family regulator